MKTPILGSAYVARSVNAADNRMVNLFPEIIPEGGKEPAFLQRCPGLQIVANVGVGPIRGLWVIGAYYYVVSGDELYQVDGATGLSTYVGTVSGSPSPISMADNGIQLFIACNGPSYIFNTVTSVFGQIVDPDFPGAVTVGFLDGFFVVNEPNTQKIWTSAVYDGTSWDATHFRSAEGSPDNVVGLIVDHKELWIFGVNTTEVWYNAGNPGFPFAPIQGAFSEIGCSGAYTITKMDNAIFWVSRDVNGDGIVYRSKGYSGERISTHAVEWHLQQNGGDFATAVAYTYQQNGHAFYLLTQNGADTTWVYDASTQAWHERQSNSAGSGDPTVNSRHRGNCYAFVDSVPNIIPFNIVGDYANSRIYSFNLDYYSDDYSFAIAPPQWIRSWRALPTGQNNLNRSAHHSLQLDIETGVAMGPPYDFGSTESNVYLRWSDDGGHTWSTPRPLSLGIAADYGKRVIWRRLGMTTKLRDRVYEVSGTDPCKIMIMGAELHVSPTNA